MRRVVSVVTILAVAGTLLMLAGAGTEAQAAGARILSPGVRAQTSGEAIRSLSGCLTNTLPANDDSSTGEVQLGFLIDFFGISTSSVYVNNNGNITFDFPLSTFTPFGLTQPTGSGPIIAPFFADVDTTGSGSGIVAINQVKYGTDTLDGHPVFCVNWTRVGYYSSRTDKQNSFQLLIISRADLAEGDFDIEFNYNQIQWDVGEASGGVDGLCPSTPEFECSPARVGYSNDTGQEGTFFEFVGSGQPGAFLDTNFSTGLIHNTRNSTQSGRYIFRVRGGGVVGDDNDDSSSPVVIDDVFFNGTTDTSNATTDPTDPQPPCNAIERSHTIWYELFAQFNGQVNINTFGSNYDTVLSVWTGTLPNLTNVACNDDAPNGSALRSAQVTPTPGSSQASFTASGGTSYLIMVSGKGNGGSLSISLANQEEGNPIPAANLQTILAHSALGGGFLTRLFLTNLSSSENSVTIHRIDQQGNTISDGSFEAILLPAGTLQIAATEDVRDDPLSVSWFAVGSLQSVAGSVLFEFDSAALGLSEDFRTAVGTLAAEPLTAFTTPVRVATAEVTVGMALANLVNSSNTVNLSLIDNLGTVVATDSITLAPFEQTAFNVHQRDAFSSIVLGVPEFIGSLAVTTADANEPVAAVVVGNNLRQLYTLPVTPGTAFGGGSSLVAPSSLRVNSSLPMPSALPTANFVTLIPHNATGGGFLSRLFVTNLSNLANNITIQRMNTTGTVVATINRTLQRGGSIMEAESETVRSNELAVQWYAIGSDQPIAAAVLFEFDGSATAATDDDFLTSVGSLSAEQLTAFTTPVRVATAEVTAGVAIANPNNQTNNLTMKLIDSQGNVVATDTLTLGAFAQTAFNVHQRAAFSDIVLGVPEFIGSLAISVNDASLPVAAIVVGNNNRQLFTLPVNEGVAQ